MAARPTPLAKLARDTGDRFHQVHQCSIKTFGDTSALELLLDNLIIYRNSSTSQARSEIVKDVHAELRTPH
jgi:hypothetical protein